MTLIGKTAERLAGFACYPLYLPSVLSRRPIGVLIAMKCKSTKLLLSGAAAGALLLPLPPLIFAQSHAPTKEIHGIAVANIDTSVQPGDDFFHYPNADRPKPSPRYHQRMATST